jgi:hypothetical protein
LRFDFQCSKKNDCRVQYLGIEKAQANGSQQNIHAGDPILTMKLPFPINEVNFAQEYQSISAHKTTVYYLKFPPVEAENGI